MSQGKGQFYHPPYAQKAYSAGTILLFAALVIICATQRTPAAEQRPRTRIDDLLKRLHYEPVAFNYEDNQPLIKGELGGKKRVFLLDSGWTITTLQARAATGLRTLGELGVVLDDGLFGTLTEPSLVVMEKLTLGGTQFLNQPARAEKLRMDYIGFSFDGVLGCDFLFRNSCVIDCVGRRLYVRSVKLSDAESKAFEESLRRSAFVEVPLHGRPMSVMDAQINSRPIQLLLDTGATHSIVDESELKDLGLTTIKQEQAGGLFPKDMSDQAVGVGKIGAHQLRFTRLNTLQIGAGQWKKIDFGVADLRAWTSSEPDSPVRHLDGLLGIDMLETYSALIDFSNHKLWLQPQKKGPRSLP